MENNQVQVFNNAEFGDVRVIMQDGEPWFVGKDVAEILGYKLPHKAVRDHVDNDDVLKWNITDSLGRAQENIIINESGLYSLILSSKLPSAKAFKRWVTSEVLPAIRKHGGYLTSEKVEEALLNPDVLIKLATQLKVEREQRIKAETQLQVVKPKVNYYDEYMKRDELFTVTFVANTMAMGQQQLYKKLCELGWLCKPYGCSHQITEKAPEGVFKLIKTLYFGGSKGSQIRITAKGMRMIQDMFDK